MDTIRVSRRGRVEFVTRADRSAARDAGMGAAAGAAHGVGRAQQADLEAFRASCEAQGRAELDRNRGQRHLTACGLHLDGSRREDQAHVPP